MRGGVSEHQTGNHRVSGTNGNACRSIYEYIGIFKVGKVILAHAYLHYFNALLLPITTEKTITAGSSGSGQDLF